MISVITILFWFIGLIIGYRRGFAKQLLNLIGYILSLILTIMFYKRLAIQLSSWIPYPNLTNDSALALFFNTLPLESAYYNVLAFILLFFLIKILLQFLSYFIRMILKLPVLNQVNRSLGAIIGLAESYIISLFIILFLMIVPIGSLQESISQSSIAKFMIQYTPFLSSLTEYIVFTDSLG